MSSLPGLQGYLIKLCLTTCVYQICVRTHPHTPFFLRPQAHTDVRRSMLSLASSISQELNETRASASSVSHAAAKVLRKGYAIASQQPWSRPNESAPCLEVTTAQLTAAEPWARPCRCARIHRTRKARPASLRSNPGNPSLRPVGGTRMP